MPTNCLIFISKDVFGSKTASQAFQKIKLREVEMQGLVGSLPNLPWMGMGVKIKLGGEKPSWQVKKGIQRQPLQVMSVSMWQLCQIIYGNYF